MASAQILTNGKALYAYNGTEWVPLNTTGNLVNSTRWQKVMTGGETSLSGNDDSGESLIYTPGYEQVYLNGVLLARDADYTATTGTTITGLTALTAGHIVEILAYNNINVGNTYTQGQIDNKIANTFTRWIDTLSASATVLSGLDDNSTTLSYTPGLEQVYVNGILLLPSEYTATSGSTVVLSEAAVSGDVIQIYTLKNFRVPNTYTIGQTDDQFLTKTSASSTYLTQAAGITAVTASATYAPVAAGGLVLLNNTSFTTQSAVAIDNIFSSTYDEYKILISITAVASGDADLRWYGRTTGGVDVTTNYVRERIVQYSTTITGSEAANSTFGSSSSNYPTYANYQIDLFNPFVNSVTTLVSNGGFVTNAGVPYQDRIFSYNGASNIFTGFKIFPSASTISGNIQIYGYKK